MGRCSPSLVAGTNWAPEGSPQGPGELWRVLPELFNSVSGRGTLI